MSRITAFIVACFTACAPSLIGACEITCATAEAAEAGMSPMHACHHHAAMPDDQRSMAAVHGCAHLDGLPVTPAEKLMPAANVPVSTADAVATIAFTPSAAAAPWAAPPRPPDRSLRTIQLRI